MKQASYFKKEYPKKQGVWKSGKKALGTGIYKGVTKTKKATKGLLNY